MEVDRCSSIDGQISEQAEFEFNLLLSPAANETISVLMSHDPWLTGHTPAGVIQHGATRTRVRLTDEETPSISW